MQKPILLRIGRMFYYRLLKYCIQADISNLTGVHTYAFQPTNDWLTTVLAYKVFDNKNVNKQLHAHSSLLYL